MFGPDWLTDMFLAEVFAKRDWGFALHKRGGQYAAESRKGLAEPQAGAWPSLHEALVAHPRQLRGRGRHDVVRGRDVGDFLPGSPAIGRLAIGFPAVVFCWGSNIGGKVEGACCAGFWYRLCMGRNVPFLSQSRLENLPMILHALDVFAGGGCGVVGAG